jgi:hypothetical protein
MGSGGSKTKTELVEIVNDVYSESVASVVQDCSTNINVSQTVDANCPPFPDYVDDATGVKSAFAENVSCLECGRARDGLINQAWMEAGGRSFALDLGGDDDDGPLGIAVESICAGVCKSCIVQNVTQNASVGFSASCQITNQVMQEMENKFQADIRQKLTENMDVLGQLTETFGSLISGGDDETNIATLVTTRLRNITNSKVGQDLTNNINVIQALDVSGRSIYVDGLTFNANAEFMSRNLAKNDITSALTTETEASLIQAIHDRNNTIGDLARTIADTFEDIAAQWETTFAIIGVVVVFLIASGAFVALFLFMQTGKNLTKPLQNLEEVFGDEQ